MHLLSRRCWGCWWRQRLWWNREQWWIGEGWCCIKIGRHPIRSKLEEYKSNLKNCKFNFWRPAIRFALFDGKWMGHIFAVCVVWRCGTRAVKVAWIYGPKFTIPGYQFLFTNLVVDVRFPIFDRVRSALSLIESIRMLDSNISFRIMMLSSFCFRTWRANASILRSCFSISLWNISLKWPRLPLFSLQ